MTAAAHKLKGSVIQMSAPRLFECAKRLEELGRQGELAEASSVCADVEACLAEVHAALRKLILLRRIPRSFRPSQPKRRLRRSRLLRG